MKNKKQWWKSKTIWTAIVAGVIGILQAAGVSIPNEIYSVLGSFGLYSLRVGKKEIQ